MAYGINTNLSAYNFGLNSNAPYYTTPEVQASPAIQPISMTPTNLSLSPDIANSAAFGAAQIAGNVTNKNGVITPNPAAAQSQGIMGGFGDMLKGTLLNKEGSLNVGNLTDLLGSIGGIYGAFKQLGLAKDQLNFSKETFRTNLANQTKSYNTALEDRLSGRYSEASRDSARDKEYLDKNRL